MVSWPESSWSSSVTLKHTFLMPPCSTLSGSPSSTGARGGGWLWGPEAGASPSWGRVGSVVDDRLLGAGAWGVGGGGGGSGVGWGGGVGWGPWAARRLDNSCR